jgi:hypothetical protein
MVHYFLKIILNLLRVLVHDYLSSRDENRDIFIVIDTFLNFDAFKN